MTSRLPSGDQIFPRTQRLCVGSVLTGEEDRVVRSGEPAGVCVEQTPRGLQSQLYEMDPADGRWPSDIDIEVAAIGQEAGGVMTETGLNPRRRNRLAA